MDEASQADFLSKVAVYAYDEAANNYIPARTYGFDFIVKF